MNSNNKIGEFSDELEAVVNHLCRYGRAEGRNVNEICEKLSELLSINKDKVQKVIELRNVIQMVTRATFHCDSKQTSTCVVISLNSGSANALMPQKISTDQLIDDRPQTTGLEKPEIKPEDDIAIAARRKRRLERKMRKKFLRYIKRVKEVEQPDESAAYTYLSKVSTGKSPFTAEQVKDLVANEVKLGHLEVVTKVPFKLRCLIPYYTFTPRSMGITGSITGNKGEKSRRRRGHKNSARSKHRKPGTETGWGKFQPGRHPSVGPNSPRHS